jgi:hypothetical protein
VPLIVFYRGFGEYYKGNWDEAEENFDHAFELDRPILQAEVGRAFSFAIQAQKAEGVAILRVLESKMKERGSVDPEAIYKIAQAFAVLGDKPSALRVWSRSVENVFFPYPYFLNDPLLDPLRSDEGFTGVMNAARRRHEAFKNKFF